MRRKIVKVCFINKLTIKTYKLRSITSLKGKVLFAVESCKNMENARKTPDKKDKHQLQKYGIICLVPTA